MKRIVLWVLILLVAGFLALCAAVNVYGLWDQAAAADTIISLGARVLSDGSPGPDLTSRTIHSAALFRAGLAPYLVCTGGFPGDRSSAAAVSRNLAIQLGVPDERILLAEDSMSTQEDAEQVARIMRERQWTSAIVVSHPLHLLRARILFQREGISVLTSPTPLDEGEMTWETRAYYTVREAMGVIAALLPKEWTRGWAAAAHAGAPP
jgi:uncharacterized SAM-binding protein YcdF (DUF218 family)